MSRQVSNVRKPGTVFADGNGQSPCELLSTKISRGANSDFRNFVISEGRTVGIQNARCF